MSFNFNFNENEVNLILQALGELQAKVSLSLINKLHTDIQQQISEQKKPDLKKIESIKKEDVK